MVAILLMRMPAYASRWCQTFALKTPHHARTTAHASRITFASSLRLYATLIACLPALSPDAGVRNTALFDGHLISCMR